MMKTLNNAVMNEMIRQLQPVLQQRNKVGYVAARNFRKISDALTEYETFKNELIEKYGEQDIDENGNKLTTISIKVGSPNFEDFYKELVPYNTLEHEVELMMAKYDEAINCLSGEEILSIDWMLED